jgi:uncharacterized protein (DUF1501 family)
MLSRRHVLHLLGASGFYSAMPKLTLARAPGDNRLVVIILRGAMDGLDVVRPMGDPAYKLLRPDAAKDNPIDLDGFFSLHPAFAEALPLFQAGELGFVHAVATPYRERSHFDGQDVLETGSGAGDSARSGWLNRLLGLMGTGNEKLAVDIDNGSELILEGPNPVQNWYPGVRVDLSIAGSQFLKLLYAGDPILEASFDEVQLQDKLQSMDDNLDPGVSARELAQLAARFLNAEARIAAFSIGGWDTHVGQNARLKNHLKGLAGTLVTLKNSLGDNWKKTAVLMCSEFGRTARFNGSGGTDHGTGSAAMFAGGLLGAGIGGKAVSTRWPGLADGNLLENRDLMPTDDVRRYAAWLIESIYGVTMADLESKVFPGLDAGDRVKFG